MNRDEHALAALDHVRELRRALLLDRGGAPLPAVMEALLSAACSYVGGRASAALWMVDNPTRRIRALAAIQLAPALASMAARDDVRPEDLPCSRCAVTGERILINDFCSPQQSPEDAGMAARHGLRACWSFPLRLQDKGTLGALTLYFAEPQEADTPRIEMAEFVADCAAATIERRLDADSRREAHTRLRASEQRYRSLTQALTSIVWRADDEGRFVAAQDRWTEYTGQSWEQQQGHGWMDAIHPDDRVAFHAVVAQAFASRSFYRIEGRLWHAPSRSWRYCQARGVPIYGEHGELVEWVGTCVDVDDQRRAEEALRTADRLKDEFIAVLAHELRNPLAPIRNAVFILKRRGSDDAQLSWAVSIVERQVAQMARLLEDLLDVSRLTRQKMKLRKARVTLDSIIESALETSRPLIEQYGHSLELNVLAGPVYVEADPARLAQVFSNLLNNAAKFTDRGGRLNLTLRVDSGEAVVSVKDNGIGIEPDMLPRLFDLFSQASPALTRSHEGLGIGLSLVRGIVELHGGKVFASSAGTGKGSEFVVRMPVAAGRGGNAAGAASSEPETAPLRILVVEDQPDAAETLSVLLQMLGHEVRTASDGQEAIETAGAFRPDVVLLDIGMPRLNGYDAADRIRELLPGALMIATTGWAQPDDIAKGRAAGFDHHLVKPVEPERLRELLLTVRGKVPPRQR